MTNVRLFGVRDSTRAYLTRKATYAVIFDDQRRVACVAEASGLFLPGGGLEPDEDPIGAVHRAVAEECARKLEIISPLDSAIQYFITKRGEPYELHASFFLARFGATLDRRGEHELSWRTASPPPDFVHECQRWAVDHALKHFAA